MITTAQAADIIKARRLIVEPVSGGWCARTAERSRLHRGTLPTWEDAVEAADQTLTLTETGRVRTDKMRLFDFCAEGVVWFRPRAGTDNDGNPVKVWDALQTSDGVRIVTGERSYHAAVIAAEAIVSPPPPSQPSPPSSPSSPSRPKEEPPR